MAYIQEVNHVVEIEFMLNRNSLFYQSRRYLVISGINKYKRHPQAIPIRLGKYVFFSQNIMFPASDTMMVICFRKVDNFYDHTARRILSLEHNQQI